MGSSDNPGSPLPPRCLGREGRESCVRRKRGADSRLPLRLKGHIGVVKWLVESAGCNLQQRNSYGCSAVHWASQGGAWNAPQV